MVLSYNDCIEKGLLRKIPPSKDKAERSIQKAEWWLEEAKKTCKSEATGSSVLASYLTMFHAARAILFFDGYREKSHACVARYLEHHAQEGNLEQEWVDLLDHSREVRHDDQYDLSFFSTRKDAETALHSAEKFLARIKMLLKQLKAGGS
jgi:uncharacterized protein (UPF0332 family)